MTGCALFTKTEYRYQTKVVGVPSEMTERLLLIPPPDVRALQAMDRLDVVNAMIDMYEEATHRVVEANIKFKRIESHVAEQQAIYTTED